MASKVPIRCYLVDKSRNEEPADEYPDRQVKYPPNWQRRQPIASPFRRPLFAAQCAFLYADRPR